MPECLHDETHDHVICTVNLRVFIRYGFLATTKPLAQKFNQQYTCLPLVISVVLSPA